MTNGTSTLAQAITGLRADSVHAMLALCDLITTDRVSPQAKVLAARAITASANSAAILTKLRRELTTPGGKP
jgi:hypothetical protein